MWVIKCGNNGKYTGMYLSVRGAKFSYDPDLRHAQVFKTKEEAERDICQENEYVVSVESQMLRS